MTLHYYRPTVATSGSTWSGNTITIESSVFKQIYIRANSSDTTFDVNIYNENNFKIRGFASITGVLNDLTEVPARGIYTIEIINASADEDFEMLIFWLE